MQTVKQVQGEAAWLFPLCYEKERKMKKRNLSDFKTELQELAARYQRERKENRIEILTSHLDFWYEFMESVFKICGMILIFIALLSLDYMNRGEMDVMTELLSGLNGNEIFLSAILPFCVMVCTITWSVSVVHGYKIRMVVNLAAILACYAVGIGLLMNGIPVFTLKGMAGVFLGSAAVKFLLITVMNLADLPSRNIILCYHSEVHRKKNGYWWY